MGRLAEVLSNYWKMAFFVLVPLLFLPLLFVWQPTSEAGLAMTNIPKVTYVIVVMACFWVSEVIPLPVTALIPLVAFPVLTAATAKSVAVQYLSDGTWLFSGGLMVAVAVEEVNLHRRIALNVLNVTGSIPGRLMAGVMFSSALLSAFISNTATTAMMLPVVMSLAVEIIAAQRQAETKGTGHHEKEMLTDKKLPYMDSSSSDEDDRPAAVRKASTVAGVVMKPGRLSKKEHDMTKALLLSVSYSASLGGTATLTGSLPNIVMKGALDKEFGAGQPINFASWSFFNVPGALINLVTAWLWLQLLYFGPRGLLTVFRRETSGTLSKSVRAVLRAELKTLGPVSFAEVSLLFWYVVALTLWLTREITGWYVWFVVDKVKYMSDTPAIIFVVITLFIWPKSIPSRGQPYEPILTWHTVEKKFPWGVILLLGGGYAIAAAAKSSGLSSMIATQLSHLNVSSFWLVVIAVVLMTYLTEFTSNTATSQIVLPIVLNLANKRCINPLYLALPVAQAASFAFMLPVATPPNAIIFSSGMITVLDMITAGSLMNILAMAEVLFGVHSWGNLMFDFYTLGNSSITYNYPAWAFVENSTCIVTTN